MATRFSIQTIHEVGIIVYHKHHHHPQWSKGISIFDLPRFENKFSINLDVYSLTSDCTVIPRYLSDNTRGDDKVVLNMSSDNHLSYVKNIDTYLSKYKCATCSHIFDHIGHLKTREMLFRKKN